MRSRLNRRNDAINGSNSVVTQRVDGIQAGRSPHNMLTFPRTESGFHTEFIRVTNIRKETRERLVATIVDATVALERCCGVATVLAIFQGEQRPSQSQWPAAMLTLDDLNVRILPSNLFKLYPRIYGPALEDVKTICRLQLGIAYMQDFRTRAKISNYFRNVLVEPPEPTCSMLALRPRGPSPDSTSVHQVPLQIYSPSASTFGRPASALSHESATTFDQLASQMSTMSMGEDISSAPPPVCRPSCTPTQHSDAMSSRRQQDTPSPSKKAELPSLALELLNSLHYGQAKFLDVLLVYTHVGRQGQEAALVDFGINRAVAKALVYLLDCK